MVGNFAEYARTALLIIDMQNAFFENSELAARREDVVANCNRLIAAARTKQLPIFNVRTVHKRDKSTWTLNMLEDDQGFLFEGSAQAKSLSELDLAGSIEIIKHRDSAFWNTELLTQLLQQRIDSLILSGVSSQTCIATTGSDAFAANLHVAIARDAVASDDPEFEDTTLKFMEQQHRQKLENTQSLTDIISSMPESQ